MTAQAGSASPPPVDAAPQPGGARAALRRQMRTARSALPTAERKRRAHLLLARMAAQFRLRPGQRIAAYIAVRGEADPSLLLARARRIGCRVYLPRIASLRHGRMAFHLDRGPRQRRRGPAGLSEPSGRSPRIAVLQLDIVLVPVVAFDAGGHRLGTGGGFYDRCFARLANRRRWRRPRLVGIAHDFQRVGEIPARPWDVTLDAIITERRAYRPRG